MRNLDVVVLGAGAAGMMAAFEAGRRSRRVLLLDHGDKPGRKILISGGGRCNFTNIHSRPESFLSENPHFARSALARYTPAGFIALVERHGIAFHEKTLGQLFCDGSARQIVTMLERECGAAGVELLCGVQVSRVSRADNPAGDVNSASRFFLTTSIGDIGCEALIVATGGLSIPKLGATGFGYDLARQFGHAVVALGHVHARGEKALLRADLQIEAAAGGLLHAAARPPRGEVCLVRALVGGEANVAVDAHHRLVRRPHVVGRELGHALRDLVHEREHRHLHCALVSAAASLKPGAVVVARQPAQERERSRGQVTRHSQRVSQ